MRPGLNPDLGIARREDGQGSTCMRSLTSLPPIVGARLGRRAGRWRRTVAVTTSVRETQPGEPPAAGNR